MIKFSLKTYCIATKNYIQVLSKIKLKKKSENSILKKRKEKKKKLCLVLHYKPLGLNVLS